MKLSFNWNRKDKPTGFILEECLSKEEAIKLKHLDFQDVLAMESKKRIEVFTKEIGEEKAIFVNSRLETDVILKNQKEGLLNWINKKKDVEPKWRKEIVREIEVLDRMLGDEELNDLIDRLAGLSLGVGVTLEETQMIVELCKKVDEAREGITQGGTPEDYEDAVKNRDEYIAKLKAET